MALGCSVRQPAPEAGDRRAVASGERDGVDTAARLPRRRPRPLPLRARSRRQRESPFFLKRVRRIRSRGTRGRRPAGGKARVQVMSKLKLKLYYHLVLACIYIDHLKPRVQ